MLLSELRTNLVKAIQTNSTLQLLYRRGDGTESLHVVAPIDLRLGETQVTAKLEYLWAYCFAEHEAEMHRLDRVLNARVLDEHFDVREVLDLWPDKWPLPKGWTIPRNWKGKGPGRT